MSKRLPPSKQQVLDDYAEAQEFGHVEYYLTMKDGVKDPDEWTNHGNGEVRRKQQRILREDTLDWEFDKLQPFPLTIEDVRKGHLPGMHYKNAMLTEQALTRGEVMRARGLE